MDTAAEIEDRLRRFFADSHPEVAAAWLFGSMGRGTPRKGSDVDIAVLLDPPPPDTLAGFRFDLADELRGMLRRPVDLVVVNRAPADLVHRVLRDGRLLVDRNPSQRIQFEVYKRNEYFDLLPYLREYRRLRRPAS